MEQSQQQKVREELKEMLGREPSCSKLIDGRVMADYYSLHATPASFTAQTEDEALMLLHEYLKNKKTSAPGT